VKGAAVNLASREPLTGLFAEIGFLNDRAQALEEWAVSTHERLLGPVVWDSPGAPADVVNGDIDRAINRLRQADRALAGVEKHFRNIVEAL
jgi:hypothetical protein